MNNFTSIFTCLLTTTIICLFGNEAMAAGKTCRDESCFAGQVADCNAGSNYTSPVIVEAQVRYSILGPHGRGCEVDMVYTRHSNPEWVHKPLLFTIDPDGDIDAQIKSAVTGCLEGKGAQWLCDGPLHDMTGGVEKITKTVAAAISPCGVDISDNGPSLYPMPRNSQWGYVTSDGEWAIEPRWAYAEPFSEGRAIVDDGGMWGVINREGNYVLEPVVRSSSCETSVGNQSVCQSPLQPFSQGCSTADTQKDGSPHPFFVDRDGRFWLDDQLPKDLSGLDIWEFGRFSGGRAWFLAMGEGLKKSYGWIDSEGKVILNNEFSGAGEFVSGRAPAASGGKYSWAYIDTDGNSVLPSKWKFNGARPFSEGLAAAEVKAYRWMYFKKEGTIAIDHVSLRGPREVIGEMLSEADIQAAGDFHDGLAPILPANMFDAQELIYIHPDGTEAFAPGSDQGLEVCSASRMPEFRNGLVQLLVADEGAECTGASAGRALLEGANAHYVYLDTSGNIVLQETASSTIPRQ